MQNINILDPNLGQSHPQLVPWVNGMRQAGYSGEQIQMYFREQMRQQMAQQQAGATQQQQQMHQQAQAQAQAAAHQQQQLQAQQAAQLHAQQQQQQSNQNHPQMNPQQTQPNLNAQQQQQAKAQMARNIVQAYTGRVSLQQVMEMPFERVQGLHNEIISRLNQNGQQQQQQLDANQQQQAQAQYASNYNTSYNPNNPQTQTPNTTMPINQPQQQSTTTNGGNNTTNDNNTTTNGNGNGNDDQFGNENPIDIVLVLLHQYPQIETWLQSMEYHGTVTSSRTHAVQFLTSLMDSQPQFTQLIKLIQQQLKSRRAQGGIDPNQVAQSIVNNPNGGTNMNGLQAMNGSGINMSNMNGINNGNGDTKTAMNEHNNSSSHHHSNDSVRKKKRSKKKREKSSKKRSKKSKKQSKRSSKKKKRRKKKESDVSEDVSYGNLDISDGDFMPKVSSSSSRKKSKKKSKKRRNIIAKSEISEAEFTGPETEEEVSEFDGNSGGESDDYRPGVVINVGHVSQRKSERKRKSKKRNLSQMSNGSSSLLDPQQSKAKKQKTTHRGKRGSNLAMYICPAPIHYNLLSVNDDNESAENECERGMYRLKLKVRRNPIKEALIRIGANTFGLNEMLDTLADIEDNDELKRTKPAKKRLKEELLCIRGCYQVKLDKNGNKNGSGDMDEEYRMNQDKCDGVDQFNAAEFLEHYDEQRKQTEDVSDDQCHICGKSSGELLLCDGCPHVFHLGCVGLTVVPKEEWFCADCVAKRESVNDGNDVEMKEKVVVNEVNTTTTNNISNKGVFGAIFMANKGERISDVKEINDVLVDNSHNAKKEEIDDDNMQMPEPDIDVVADTNDNDQSNNESMQMLPSPNGSDSGKDEHVFDDNVNENEISKNVEAVQLDTQMNEDTDNKNEQLDTQINDNANDSNEQSQHLQMEPQMNEDVNEQTNEPKQPTKEIAEIPPIEEQKDQSQIVQETENEIVETPIQNTENTESAGMNEMDHPIEVQQSVNENNDSSELQSIQSELAQHSKVDVMDNEFKNEEEDKHLNESMDFSNDSVSNDTICSEQHNNENVQVTANQTTTITNEDENELEDNNDKLPLCGIDDVKMTNIENVDIEQKECEGMMEKEQKNEDEDDVNMNTLLTGSQEF